MTNIKCLGTSSSGNCYLINSNNELLILELGLRWSKLLDGINYKIDNVAGCLVSHR